MGECPELLAPIWCERSDGPGGFDGHAHLHVHQLVWAPEGVVVVGVGDLSWVLPPAVALWVPAGVYHVVSTTRSSTMVGLYFCAVHVTAAPQVPTPVAVGALFVELVAHLRASTPGTSEYYRAAGVLLDLVRPGGPAAMHVRVPRDARARQVALALIDDPADCRSLAAWGREVGAGERTLSRLFAEQGGSTFAHWRARVRVRASLDHLSAGIPLAGVARRVGYSTPSAYAAAFRRITGGTPGQYLSGRSATRDGRNAQ